MDTTRIKVKIGDHEFDAEGPVEIVQAQFEAFRQIVSSAPIQNQNAQDHAERQPPSQHDHSRSTPHVRIDKIMHVSGRIVSLTALPKSHTDAALLIMLGHKDMRNNVAVTGQEIGDGLDQSGRGVPRVDRIMDQALRDSLVLKTGVKRGTRYRLTNQGLAKALTVATDLIASLP